jgi:tRNA A-37 threonylcarbamoyl transferase component Bud32
MLTPDDAEVVRRDRTIPGLQMLLDNDAFADILRSSGAFPQVDEVQATYTRYKPGTSCLVSYRIKAAEVVTQIYAKAYTPASSGKLQKARIKKKTPGILPHGIAVLDDIGIIIYAFPHDHKLGSLANLFDKKKRRQLLSRLLPDHSELWNVRATDLHYKPERRYVAKIVSKSGQRAVLKVYAEDEYPGAECGSRFIKSNGTLRVARCMGRSRRHHILIFEWIKGDSLRDAVRHPDFSVERVHDVGTALAEIHLQNQEKLRHRTREEEAVSTLSAAEAFAAVCPTLAQPVRRFALRTAGNLLKAPAQTSPIHGDFSPEQVLLRNGRIAVLDFDSASLGDPAADIGTFRARLERDAIKGEMTPGRKEELMTALVGGYVSATQERPPSRIGLYTAVALLQLLPDSFRYREPDWVRLAKQIFERSMEIASDD